MSDRKDRDVVSEFIDLLEGARSIAESNEELINSFLGNNDSISLNLDGKDPLAEAHVTEDEVTIVAEVGGLSDGEVGIKSGGGFVEILCGDKSFRVDVPVDVDINKSNASLSNNVLEVSIPRVDIDETSVELGGDEDGSS